MMKTKRLLLMVVFLAAAACTSNTLDRGDSEKCLAGEVWSDDKQQCIPAGCTQDIHCDNGNPCDGLERCIDGRCSRGGVIVESCDDGIGCTQDFCDKVLAECVHVVHDELCEKWEQCDPQDDCVGQTCSGDQICSDGLYCNGEEKCVDGQCLAGQRDCDDGVPCTSDSCREDSAKCQHVPEHDACPQGEICNPEQGCIELPCDTDDYCDDGSFCNGEEICSNGKCIGGLAVDCDDQVVCTLDECDETGQKCVNTVDDSLCDDGKYCNGIEMCDANSGCASGIPIACHDTVDCTDDSCNEDVDACQYDPRDENCATDEICDPIRDCVERPRCTTDADCPGGMVCQNGDCIGQTEEPQPMDGGDDGGMEEEDGGYGDDGLGDDGGADDDGGDEPCLPVPEICNGLDDNCDGTPDDGDVCACLTGCDDFVVCELQGNAQCEHIPPFMTACIEPCMGGNSCSATTEAEPQVCVDVPEYALGPVCMCETDACPQECQFDRDCYPYGLTLCDVDFKCRSFCADNKNCPPPYVCEQALGICVCDPSNIGFSCLACDLETDCHLGAPCSYRDSSPDRFRMFKECQYDCTKNADCPQAQYDDELYCHWGEANTPNRCACSPETTCAQCIQADPDPCEISWMNCMSFTNPWGGHIATCTAACQLDEFCPAGWYCWDDGISTHGWCIEKECHCSDTQCGSGGIDPVECPMMFPGFECILDTGQDPPVELCTKFCGSHVECPVGYWCDTEGTAGSQVCRCSAPPPP